MIPWWVAVVALVVGEVVGVVVLRFCSMNSDSEKRCKYFR